MEPNSNGAVYQVSMINESGLYAAIFGSKQENAKKFKSIEKTPNNQRQIAPSVFNNITAP